MLSIEVEMCPEGWDEKKQEFIEPKRKTLLLEHSLLSLSKWESKWNKAFLGKQEKTDEETLDYIRCMTVSPNVDPEVYYHISDENVEQIREYIEAPMTATKIRDIPGSRVGRDTVTSELIYYWMISANIPFSCEKWHLNRLLALIKVCGVKNSPPKKHSQQEIMRRNSELNAQRRKQFNTNG